MAVTPTSIFGVLTLFLMAAKFACKQAEAAQQYAEVGLIGMVCYVSGTHSCSGSICI